MGRAIRVFPCLRYVDGQHIRVGIILGAFGAVGLHDPGSLSWHDWKALLSSSMRCGGGAEQRLAGTIDQLHHSVSAIHGRRLWKTIQIGL